MGCTERERGERLMDNLRLPFVLLLADPATGFYDSSNAAEFFAFTTAAAPLILDEDKSN